MQCILAMQKRARAAGCTRVPPRSQSRSTAQYAVPGNNAQFYTRQDWRPYTSLYRRDEIGLKVSKLAWGCGKTRNQRSTLEVKRRKTGKLERDRERGTRIERTKKGNLIYFTLYRKIGIHMSVYTQKYVSPLPGWYGFIHALNSSGGFFLFPWSFSFSCALCFPTALPTLQLPLTSVLFSVHSYPLATEQTTTATSSGKRCLSLFHGSPFAFSATTLIGATARGISDVSFVDRVVGRVGRRNETGKKSFNFFRSSRSGIRSFYTWKTV